MSALLDFIIIFTAGWFLTVLTFTGMVFKLAESSHVEDKKDRERRQYLRIVSCIAYR